MVPDLWETPLPQPKERKKETSDKRKFSQGQSEIVSNELIRVKNVHSKKMPRLEFGPLALQQSESFQFYTYIE